MQKSKGKISILNLKLLLLVLCLLFFGSFFTVVRAHEAKSDNGIGAILHVDPGDLPVAGQQSTLFFEFTDMEGKFNINNCNCFIEIERNDQEILNQEFNGASGTEGTSAVVPFVFPGSDIYRVVVKGDPEAEGQFKPFKLNFSVRVEKDLLGNITEQHERHDNTWVDHLKHYSFTIIVIIALAIALFFTKHKKKIAVILLALVLVSHLLPVKAIHAAHSGSIDGESYVCCIPQVTVLPESHLGFEVQEEFNNNFWFFESKELIKIYSSLNSRSPPVF